MLFRSLSHAGLFVRDANIIAPSLRLLSSSTDESISLSAGGSGSKLGLDVAGSVNRTLSQNTTESQLLDGVVVTVSGGLEVLSQHTAKVTSIAGAYSVNTNGFIALGAALDLGEIRNNARALIASGASVIAGGDIRIRANASDKVNSVASSLARSGDPNEKNRLYQIGRAHV